jgi:hypothetical protein
MANLFWNLIQTCLNIKKEDETQDPNKHFVNFKVVDENGKPLEGITLLVTLPDGSSEEQSTNKDGMIEIKNIDPGNCILKSDWKKVKLDESVIIK